MIVRTLIKTEGVPMGTTITGNEVTGGTVAASALTGSTVVEQHGRQQHGRQQHGGREHEDSYARYHLSQRHDGRTGQARGV